MPQPDESKLLEKLDKAVGVEQRDVAIRLRRLAYEIVGEARGTQVRFHEAMGGEDGSEIRRTELVTAWGGGSLCQTPKWLRAIAKAAGVPLDAADAYLSGKLSLEDMLAPTPQPTVAPDEDRYARVLNLAAQMVPPASSVDVLRVVKGLAAMKGSATDTDIVRELRSKSTSKAVRATVVDDDDLGGGLSSSPKLSPKRKK